jgi:uncharacterized repeat protein (TIGR01451 family)
MEKIKNNNKVLVMIITLVLISTAFISLVVSDPIIEPVNQPKPILKFLGTMLQNLVDRFPFLGQFKIIQKLLVLFSGSPTPPPGGVLPIPSGSIVPAVYEITTNKWVGGNPSGYVEGDTAAMGALLEVGNSGDGYWLVNLTMQVHESPFTNAYGFTDFEQFDFTVMPQWLFGNNRHNNTIPIDYVGDEWDIGHPFIWLYNAEFVEMIAPSPYEPTLGVGGFDNYIGVSVKFTKNNDDDCWILFGGHIAVPGDPLPADSPEDPPSIDDDYVDDGEGASAMTGVFQTRVGAGGDKTINFKPSLIFEPTACINIDKQADVTTATVGETITYSYTVTNCGDATLTGVTVIDDMLGSISLGTTTLSPGASTSGTAMYTVQESDLPGPIVNTATATGTTPTGGTVSDTDTESVDLICPCDPSIDIDKEADVTEAEVGDTITYTYTVTNDGNSDLNSVAVVDDMLGSISLGATTLIPGASTSGTAMYTVQESDLPGPIVNTATATGVAVCNCEQVSDQDSESVDLITPCDPSIDIDKEADVTEAEVGDTITYTYTVTNDGNSDLYNVQVVDDMLGSITLGTNYLIPGGSTTGTATYTVVEGDLPGPIVNTATATGYGVCNCEQVSDQDSESVDLITPCDPSIDIDKEADVTEAEVGDTITYTYTVTNDGNSDLNSVAVVDDMLGSISLGATTLIPGASTSGTAMYTVQESDLPGPIVNIATATGVAVCNCEQVSDQDSESVCLTFTACIDIDKEADVATATVGQTITYTYTVTNCGDVTLTGVNVVDDMLGSISLGATTLIPGASTSGTAMYTVQESDLPGPIVNIATATGTTPTGGTVSDTDTESVEITIPCPPEVWVDDNWFNQADVNTYNPSLIWGHNAFRDIQDGIDIVCPCGTVYVRAGLYAGQFLINKSLQLLGEPGAEIHGNNLQNFIIDSSSTTYKPVIFAFAGTLVGNNVVSSSIYISVKVDGFEIYGDTGAIAVLYHNVQNGCVPNQISNNKIYEVSIGVQLNGCTKNTLVIFNKMYWASSGHTAVLLTPFVDCEPTGIIINNNYWGAPCSLNIGVDNQGTETVDARYNWWSADDGPSSPSGYDNYDAFTGRIADGLGDKVIGPVMFDPWYGVDSYGHATKYTVHVNDELICFDGTDSFAYDETGYIPITTYKWTFGDGSYSFDSYICRFYHNAGLFQVSLLTECSSYTLDPDFVSGFLRDWTYFTVTVTG